MKSPLITALYLTLIGVFTVPICFASAPASEQNLKPQIIQVADKESFIGNIADGASLLASTQNSDANDTNTIVIYRPEASFIKVHFNHFSIPLGSRVVVRNVMGTQAHVYGALHNTPYTLDSSAGDDGVASFAALSIIGDAAVVEYQANGNDAPYTISIDYIMRGHHQDLLESTAQSQSEGIVGPTSVCGVNERRDAACWATSHPTEYERARPVARLLINGSGLCTAWRVGAENHVLTNNHCLATQADVAAAELWFNYQRTSCSGATLAPTTVVSGAELLATDYTLDYTLFTINNFNTVESFGHFGLDVRNAIAQEEIYIPQHGAGNPKELAIESDQNVGGVCRIDNPLVSGRAPNSDMGYYCDTVGGSSGSPVLAKSSNAVIAIHHFGGCLNQGVRVAAIWPQIASHFGGQVPASDDGSSIPVATPSPTPNPVVELVANQTLSPLAGTQGETQLYALEVPAEANNVSISISGGSGDADLYVRAGAVPTTTAYDCRPYVSGSNEQCFLAPGTHGTVYIMLRGFNAFSGLSLLATYDTEPPSGASSGSEIDLASSDGGWIHFPVTVPAGTSALSATIGGGSGDADLYLNFGTPATLSAYSCRPYLNGSEESCTLSDPQVGTWYISLRAYRAFSGVDMAWQYQL